MSSGHIDCVEVLCQHGRHLLAALDNIHHNVLDGPEKFFEVPEISALVKAVRDGRTTDQAKFPHLTDEMAKKYGNILRQPYAILNHYMDFQVKTHKLFIDIFNMSKIFDFSWNYTFTMPVVQLFTYYVKLAVFVVRMNEVDTIPIVYDYCVKNVTKNSDQSHCALVQFIRERMTFVKLNSELQLFNNTFFSLFKAVINVMYRLLNAGLSYEWAYLNLNDNPSEYDPLETEFPFFQSEYVVMMHLELICECFICYCLSNFSVVNSDTQFGSVIQLVMAHTPCLHMHGDTQFPIAQIFEDLKKIRKVKSDRMNVIDAAKGIRKNMIPIKQYRCRKLAMIIEEYTNAFEIDPKILCSKFVIIQSLLGFAHYTAVASLATFEEDIKGLKDEEISIDMIALVHQITQAVNHSLRKIDTIKRYLIYNLREYDAPYLNHLMHSFNIPSIEYERFTVVYQALQQIDVEKYDNGTNYNLSGLRITLMRIMGSFNLFSTTNGFYHLIPLFNLVSALFFRVNILVNSNLFFVDFAPLNKYWRFLGTFEKASQFRDLSNSSEVASIISLVDFYSLNLETLSEYPGYHKLIMDHSNKLVGSMITNINSWITYLQDVGLQNLDDQITLRGNSPRKENQEDKEKKPQSILAVSPGIESRIQNRKYLTDIFQKLSSISNSFYIFNETRSVHVFSKTLKLFDGMVKELTKTFVRLYKFEKLPTPERLRCRLQNTRFIMTYILNAARVDPNPIIAECMKMILDAPLVEEKGLKVINMNGMGILGNVYIPFFKDFFRTKIIRSCYSTVSQSFIKLFSKDKNDQEIDYYISFASKSSIRTLHKIIGISGMACIDILAADSIASLYKHFIGLIKKSAGHNGSLDFLEDPFNLPAAADLSNTLCHIGAISKYRQLIRQTLPDDAATGEYAFLSRETTPETDIVLLSRIGEKVIKNFKSEWIPSLMLSIFCSPYMSQVKYDASKDSFISNLHLMGFAFDNIAGAIIRNEPSFNLSQFYSNLVIHIYQGAILGRENLKTKKVLKWRMPLFILMLDHFTKASCYLDYSILEPVIPYQLIRSVYTRVLSHRRK